MIISTSQFILGTCEWKVRQRTYTIFTLFGVLDRIDLSKFDDKIRQPDIEIMPSLEDEVILNSIHLPCNKSNKYYSVEAFIMLALSPLVWLNSFCGLELSTCMVRLVENVPCDIHMEHLNRLCKNSLGSLGSNITDKAVDRIGKCIGELVKVNANYDANNMIPLTSGKHSTPSTKKDVNRLIEELSEVNMELEMLGALLG